MLSAMLPNNATVSVILSVGEIHSVYCCRTTKIDRPPWIGFSIRVRTPWYTVLVSNCFMHTVIGQTCWMEASVITEHTALVSRTIQRCVVCDHCGVYYKRHKVTFHDVNNA